MELIDNSVLVPEVLVLRGQDGAFLLVCRDYRRWSRQVQEVNPVG
jgi:hypothetical protein